MCVYIKRTGTKNLVLEENVEGESEIKRTRTENLVLEEDVEGESEGDDVDAEDPEHAEERRGDGAEHVHVHAEAREHLVEEHEVHPAQEHGEGADLPLHVLQTPETSRQS